MSSTEPRSLQVTFIEPDGSRKTVAVAVGDNLMHSALANNINGISGQCYGAMLCATCLVDIDKPWIHLLPDQLADEQELLCYVDEAGPLSRLSCQIEMAEYLDGLEVTVQTTV